MTARVYALLQTLLIASAANDKVMTACAIEKMFWLPLLQAINNFCREMGITRSENMIYLHMLEHHVSRTGLLSCSYSCCAMRCDAC